MAVSLAALRMASTPASGRSDLSGAGPPPPGNYKVGLGALRHLSNQSVTPGAPGPHPTPVPKSSGFMPALPEPVPMGHGPHGGVRSISPIQSPPRSHAQASGFPSAPPGPDGMSVSQYRAVQDAQAEAAAMVSPAASPPRHSYGGGSASPKRVGGKPKARSKAGEKRETLPATGFRAMTYQRTGMDGVTVHGSSAVRKSRDAFDSGRGEEGDQAGSSPGKPDPHYSRARRAVDYKPKTLADYKAAYGDGKYMELGHLGGDTESEEVVAKRLARKRMKEYAAGRGAENAALLAQRKAKGGKAPPAAVDPDAAAAAAREAAMAEAAAGRNKARDYAAKVASRNRKRLTSERGSRSAPSGSGAIPPVPSPGGQVDSLTGGRPTAGRRPPNTAQAARAESRAYAAHRSQLEELLATHDSLKGEVERIRQSLAAS